MNILILGGLFVWAVLAPNQLLTRLLSNALLRGLGRISYMFYLLHEGVLSITSRHFGRMNSAGIAFGHYALAILS